MDRRDSVTHASSMNPNDNITLVCLVMNYTSAIGKLFTATTPPNACVVNLEHAIWNKVEALGLFDIYGRRPIIWALNPPLGPKEPPQRLLNLKFNANDPDSGVTSLEHLGLKPVNACIPNRPVGHVHIVFQVAKNPSENNVHSSSSSTSTNFARQSSPPTEQLRILTIL